MHNIRNFCILAHVDHGKSTLADRFLELTGTVEKRRMREQYLDMNPIEREKGITIKMQPVRMVYHAEIRNPKSEIQNKSQIQNTKFQNNFEFRASNFESAGSEFILNLIDTPGHADFSYEVSRALAAVEGAILLVDATQGVQAQTLANLHLARMEGLTIIPAINKIDLPLANIPEVEKEISQLLKVGPPDIWKVSAKTGEGVEELLRAVIERVRPPVTSNQLPVTSSEVSPPNGRALVFDSAYDPYRGVIAHIRVFDGEFKKGDKLFLMASRTVAEAFEIGVFVPERSEVGRLSAGEIGYVATGIKEPEKVRVGDTITSYQLLVTSSVEPLPGYREPASMVFASVFTESQDEYETLRDSLGKLKLNDAALSFEPEILPSALGRGFRVGFLGRLHMEIVSERLRREYGLALVFSHPSVAFRVRSKNGGEEIIYSAATLTSLDARERTEELWVVLEIISPARFLSKIGTLLRERGGKILETQTLSSERLIIRSEMPLREIMADFYDALKSISQGFASLSYEVSGWREADVALMRILVAGEGVGALAEIVPREKAYHIARRRIAKLKELLPRRLFSIALQAEVEGRIVARETIPALRKDVTGYLYGGDRTRKMKLWKKQERGKKKLKERGRIVIPAEVFLKMLKPR